MPCFDKKTIGLGLNRDCERFTRYFFAQGHYSLECCRSSDRNGIGHEIQAAVSASSCKASRRSESRSVSNPNPNLVIFKNQSENGGQVCTSDVRLRPLPAVVHSLLMWDHNMSVVLWMCQSERRDELPVGVPTSRWISARRSAKVAKIHVSMLQLLPIRFRPSHIGGTARIFPFLSWNVALSLRTNTLQCFMTLLSLLSRLLKVIFDQSWFYFVTRPPTSFPRFVYNSFGTKSVRILIYSAWKKRNALLYPSRQR